jgi:hypothetical protein
MGIYRTSHESFQDFVESAIELYTGYDEKRKECQRNGRHINEVYSEGTGMIHCIHCSTFYEKTKTPEEDRAWQETVNTPFINLQLQRSRA